MPKVTLLISGRADCGLRALIAKALALDLDLHLWATLPFNHSGTRPGGTIAEQFSSRAPRWGLSWCVPQAACCWPVSKEPALSISVPCSSAISSLGSGLGLPARLVQPRSKGVGGPQGDLGGGGCGAALCRLFVISVGAAARGAELEGPVILVFFFFRGRTDQKQNRRRVPTHTHTHTHART